MAGKPTKLIVGKEGSAMSNEGIESCKLKAKLGTLGNEGIAGRDKSPIVGSIGNEASKLGIGILMLKARLGILGNEGSEGNPRDNIAPKLHDTISPLVDFL